MSQEEDLARVADRPNIDRARALIDDEIRRIEESERHRVFAAIRNDTLEPQQALQSWMRLEAVDAVKRGLERRSRQARSASERVAPDM